MAGMNLETVGMGQTGTLSQRGQFSIAFDESPFMMQVAKMPGMQFDYRRADPGRGFDLAGVVTDEHGHPAAGLAQGRDVVRKARGFGGDIQAAFGCAFLSLLGNKADSMRAMTQRDLLHLIGCRTLEIEGHGEGCHQPLDIIIAYMAPILAQVRGDPVGPGLFGQ